MLYVLDARDPIGTRSPYIEKYLKTEKPHKHFIFVLNKIDLVPVWITVSVSVHSVDKLFIVPYSIVALPDLFSNDADGFAFILGYHSISFRKKGNWEFSFIARLSIT